jgi:hypothetical protein
MRKILLVICLLFLGNLSLAQDEAQTPYDIALERILEAQRSGL